jgi:hypothetical protein
MWRNEVGNRRVIVHFYADGDGCDFYACGNENTWSSVIVHFYADGDGCDFYACGNENTWSSVEELLKEPGK